MDSRKTKTGWFFNMIVKLSGRLLSRCFKPDILLNEGDDLSPYGLDAKIVHTPGHSLGSISILTAEGDFFCGDFLKNNGKPTTNSLVDDPAEMEASVLKLKGLNIKTVYPGHGKPFNIEEFLKES
jgi:glyoxylase-like metal-dependent hydrolase (beta-lactamase superfamily II)